MDKRLALGYSDKALSFLLGYRSTYVRDVEDPTHTLRYSPKDINYLMQIFNCRLPELMPDKILQSFFHIKVSISVNEDGETVYKVFKESSDKNFFLYRTIKTGGSDEVHLQSKADAAEIRKYMTHLFETDFFTEAKTSLEIFKKCSSRFGSPLRPQHLIDAVSFYTAKRKKPRLIRMKNRSGRTIYVKEV